MGALIGFFLFSTTLESEGFETSVQKADAILIGQIHSISYFQDDGFSILELEVLEKIKGEVEDSVSIRVQGDATSEKKLIVVGTPEFFEGEKSLFFLKKSEDGLFSIRRLHEGKKTIVEKEEGFFIPELKISSVEFAKKIKEGDYSDATSEKKIETLVPAPEKNRQIASEAIQETNVFGEKITPVKKESYSLWALFFFLFSGFGILNMIRAYLKEKELEKSLQSKNGFEK